MALKSPLLRLNKTYLSLLFFLHTFVPFRTPIKQYLISIYLNFYGH